MKRFFSIVLLFAVLLTLSGCGSAVEDKSLKEHGLEVIALMDEAVNSEAYLQAFSASENLNAILTEAAGDRTAPSAVFAVTFPETEQLLRQDTAIAETLTDVMRHKLYAAIPSQINARGGAETLAAASLCTMGKTFISEEITSDVIYLYVYPHACPVAVTFTTGEDSTVSAAGMFLLADFPTDSGESLVEALGGFAQVELVTD